MASLTSKVLRIKTTTATHATIRDGAGKKLFDMDLCGISIVVAVPSDAEIHVDPPPDIASALGSAQEPRSIGAEPRT
jgi:hypothetical protein